jgi:hypothetical protein
VAFGVGDPRLSWLYQPAVRTFRVRLSGDDPSFLRAGLPAVFASDSSFSAFYPWYHQPGDTADRLDAAALERMGRGVVGIVEALERASAGPAAEPTWFAALGGVLGGTALLGLAAAALGVGLLRSLAAGPLAFFVSLMQTLLAALALWRHPVPSLWVLLLPIVVTAVTRRFWASLLALAPAAGLAALGFVGWQRGMVAGLWLEPWEVIVLALALALLWLRPASAAPARRRKAPRRRGLPKD